MISTNFFVAAVLALVASSFAAELNLKELRDTDKTDLGLHVNVRTKHNILIGWFKPFIGKEVTKIIGDNTELWKTEEKDHELNEFLLLAKCSEIAFAVVSELNAQGGLIHHYLELEPDGAVRKVHTDFKGFIEVVLITLHKLGAVDALQPPYPDVPFHFFFRHLKMAGEKAKAQVAHTPTDAPAS